MFKILIALGLFMTAVSAQDYAPPKRKRIYLMRHGDVSYFLPNGQVVADPDVVPLNELGRKQAEAAGVYLASLGVKKFDRVITSTLPRTVETAEGVLKAMGIEAKPEQIAGLREIKSGPATSTLKVEDMPASFLAFRKADVAPETPFLIGETLGAMQARIYPEFDKLIASDFDTALVVLHGVVNTGLLSYMIAGKPAYFGKFETGSGCMNILDVGKSIDDTIIRAVNLCPMNENYTGSRVSTMEKLLIYAIKSKK
jgi:broad specificity phosphatase PhoE